MTQKPVYPTETDTTNQGLSRLVTAAVVNRTFCQLLLNDPAQALETGYSGETFELTPEERRAVLSIQATSLTDFARQLLAAQNGNGHYWGQNGHKVNDNGYRVYPASVSQQLVPLKT